MRLLKTTTTTPYVYAHIYEESTGDVARLRGGEKAERSEESALFKLLSGCFCFVLFICFIMYSSVSLSRVVVVVVRISRSGVLLLTYSISARSRGFYRANKNSILSVKKNVLHTHTHVCVCTEFSSGAFSRALDV